MRLCLASWKSTNWIRTGFITAWCSISVFVETFMKKIKYCCQRSAIAYGMQTVSPVAVTLTTSFSRPRNRVFEMRQNSLLSHALGAGIPIFQWYVWQVSHSIRRMRGSCRRRCLAQLLQHLKIDWIWEYWIVLFVESSCCVWRRLVFYMANF